MDVEFNAQRVEIPELHAAIAGLVAIDVENRRLLVDPSRVTDPLVQTWLHRCSLRGLDFAVEPTDLDEIYRHRETGFRPQAHVRQAGPDSEKANLDAAMEILEQGAFYKASDIHIRRRTITDIEFRIKRALRAYSRKTIEEGQALERAFYSGLATSKSGSFMPLAFQDAEISGPAMEKIGLSTVRIIHGFSAPSESGGGIMVLRLQPNGSRPFFTKGITKALPYPRISAEKPKLRERGYTQPQVDRLIYLAEGTSGVVFFTGPTGSGKTTTMADLMRHTAIISPDLRQITIERPVEIPLPFAVQIPITGHFATPEEEGAAIAGMLKNILRMDPDIIACNEIRIDEVARVVLEAAMTGHKVYSSIHTNCPFEFAERIEMLNRVKLPRVSFCNHKLIRGVVNQRLVPMLCDHCSKPLSDAPSDYLTGRQADVLRSYGDLSRVRIRGAGCEHCGFDGAVGQRAVAEVIVTDAELMQDLLVGSALARKNYRARAGADISVLAAAMDLVVEGLADVLDVNKYVDTIERSDVVNL